MPAAAECLADFVRVSANIKSLAAQNTEVDVRNGDVIDRVAINVNKSRFAFDDLSLSREFVERHAYVFFRRNHWRGLIKIAAKFVKCSANIPITQLRHGFGFDYFT